MNGIGWTVTQFTKKELNPLKELSSLVKCPEPESNQWHEDFQSSALPTELSGHRLKNKSSSGDRIWTYDLRVMSPTSFQTAPSRAMKLLLIIFVIKRMGRGGFEPPKQFAADLQSVPFGHSGIHPKYRIFNCTILYWFLNTKPMIGLEPITCWLQISCSANWATSAYYTTQLICNQPALPTIVSLHSTIVMNWTTSAYTQHSWFVISSLCLQLSYRIQQLSWIEPHRHIFNTPKKYQ